jgi:hypothetical protein
MRSSAKAGGGRNPGNPVVHYGSRKSPKLIRTYKKEELDVFRIEGEFHSSFLRLQGIDSEQDIGSVADEFYPAHIRFVEIDWRRLRTHVEKKYGKEHAAKILASARKRESSIHRVTRYLRRRGILNVHRFYRSLSINKQIKRALERWSADYNYEWQMARMKTDRGEK